jgi:PAP_fibrillin
VTPAGISGATKVPMESATKVTAAVDNDSSDDDDDNEEQLQILDNIDGDEPDPSLETELEAIYESLCDNAGLISKEQLRNWDEVVKLLEDGLLGVDEFNEIWSATNKSSASSGAVEKLDVDGFLSFNVALDDLFAFDDEDMEDEDMDELLPIFDEDEVDGEVEAINDADARQSVRMIAGDGLSPDTLFVALANENGLIGLDEIKRWSELKEMITDGDLLESELLDLFKNARKSEMDLNKVELEGFLAIYNEIDNLFEDEDNGVAAQENSPARVSHKAELLDAIADLNIEDVLPCGLEATEVEQREILSIVEMVENDPSNLIRLKQGVIDPKELSGDWELLYSSSSAMKFNKGLSGLGGSAPNGRFGTLKQKLVVTKYLTDVEYTEHIEMKPSSASFDVKVTGTWDLRSSVSLFTGEPSIVMNVVPDRVTYGPTSTRADHWKSLGPMNMLDISYLDEDLRIMRGNTSVDTIFVFRRTQTR